MDFKTVCKFILGGFEREKIRYALMGGFALGILGVPRATVDLDFLVHSDDLPKIRKLMKENGYECFHQTENVSQYTAPLKVFGEIDFLHAFRKYSLRMLERAIEREIFDGNMKIKVLKPEDLIGYKVQCAANNETRMNKEYLDIESLISYYKTDLDWELIEEYFSLFAQETAYNELRRKYFGPD